MNYYKHTNWNGKFELVTRLTIALHVEEDGKLIETHTLLGDKDYWIIGRTTGTGLSGQSTTSIVDIEVTHESCSRQHCVIQLRAPDRVYLFDLSSGGTFLNDKRVKRLTYHRLRHMDIVRVGRSSRYIRIELHEQEVAARLPQTTKPLLSSNGSQPTSPRFVHSALSESPARIPVKPGSPLGLINSSLPTPTAPLSQLSPSLSPTSRKRTFVSLSPTNSPSQVVAPSDDGNGCKRLKIKSSFSPSRSRSPNIQPMTKAYEKAVQDEE